MKTYNIVLKMYIINNYYLKLILMYRNYNYINTNKILFNVILMTIETVIILCRTHYSLTISHYRRQQSCSHRKTKEINHRMVKLKINLKNN